MINITQAEYLDNHVIHLCFDDGKEQTIDFKTFLSQSVHPDIRAYLDTEKFKDYRIEYGELVWGDYDLCFPVIDLYNNQLLPPQAEQLAA